MVLLLSAHVWAEDPLQCSFPSFFIFPWPYNPHDKLSVHSISPELCRHRERTTVITTRLYKLRGNDSARCLCLCSDNVQTSLEDSDIRTALRTKPGSLHSPEKLMAKQWMQWHSAVWEREKSICLLLDPCWNRELIASSWLIDNWFFSLGRLMR